jgi:hypothetical protein
LDNVDGDHEDAERRKGGHRFGGISLSFEESFDIFVSIKRQTAID